MKGPPLRAAAPSRRFLLPEPIRMTITKRQIHLAVHLQVELFLKTTEQHVRVVQGRKPFDENATLTGKPLPGLLPVRHIHKQSERQKRERKDIIRFSVFDFVLATSANRSVDSFIVLHNENKVIAELAALREKLIPVLLQSRCRLIGWKVIAGLVDHN